MMHHLFLAPLYAIGAIALWAGGKTLYDAVVASPHPWETIGLIVLSAWTTLIILYAMSRP